MPGNLTKMQMFAMDIGDTVGGPLPESIGGWSDLLLFTMEQCSMTGPIPESWNKLTSVKVIHLGENR